MNDPVSVETLVAYAGQISEAAARSNEASLKQHLFIHGNDQDDVGTESGPVPSIAKQARLSAEQTAALQGLLAAAGLGKGTWLLKFPGSGVNPKPRDLTDKLNDIVSTKDRPFSELFVSGTNAVFPAEVINLTAPIAVNGVNGVVIQGAGMDRSRVITTASNILTFTGSVKNVYIYDMSFESAGSTATSSLNGLLYSDNANIENVYFVRCRLRCADLAINGAKFVQETGIAINVRFIDCDIPEIGRMGIEFQNHVADTVDRYFGIQITGLRAKNTGLKVGFGMGISMSGYGSGCLIDDCEYDNMRNIGLEVVGMRNSLVNNQRFKGFGTYAYAPMQFTGTRLHENNTITNCKELEPGAGRTLLRLLKGCTVDGLNKKSAYVEFLHVVDCDIKNINSDSADTFAGYMGGNSYDNRLSETRWDNSRGVAANQACFRFDGAGVTNNIMTESSAIKPPGGATLSQDNGAVGNRVLRTRVDGRYFEVYYDPDNQRRATGAANVVAAVGGISKLVLNFGAPASWTQYMLKFSVYAMNADSTGRAVAERKLAVRFQGVMNPVISASGTIIADTSCTITYQMSAGVLKIVCTQAQGAISTHRWSYEVTGGAPTVTTE